MNLPLIDYFANGAQPINVNSIPIVVSNHVDLAERAIQDRVAVDNFVDRYLTKTVIASWQQPMGSKVPLALKQYQHRKVQIQAIDTSINGINAILSAGQKLYRGGCTLSGVQSGVLSTTFSPAVAINVALWNGKAKQAGVLRLYVLCAVHPQTRVYVFNQRRGALKHEKEVLFASKANVTIGKKVKQGAMSDGLPYEIFEATIS